MPRNRSEQARDRAREARQGVSVAEEILWKAFRGSKTGLKFRREHAVGGYRLDFYCHEALLAVELDGEQHEPDRNAVRDQTLSMLGILTHRIPNRRFFGTDDAPYRNDLAEIVRLCEERSGRKAF